MTDQMLPCDACGGTFPFAAKEAEFYAEKGFNPPKRCAGARQARKATGTAERYDACPFGPDGRGAGPAPAHRNGHGGGPGDRGGYGNGGHGNRGGWNDRPAAPRVPRPRPVGTGRFHDGAVVKVFADRGFGFIKADGGQDFFFDADEVEGDRLHALQPGTRVRFEESESPKGPRAKDITIE